MMNKIMNVVKVMVVVLLIGMVSYTVIGKATSCAEINRIEAENRAIELNNEVHERYAHVIELEGYGNYRVSYMNNIRNGNGEVVKSQMVFEDFNLVDTMLQ